MISICNSTFALSIKYLGTDIHVKFNGCLPNNLVKLNNSEICYNLNIHRF
jgi:hypothetical protein